jgi:hypothetical protein
VTSWFRGGIHIGGGRDAPCTPWRSGVDALKPAWKRAYLIRRLRWYDLMVQIPRMTKRLPPGRLNRPAFDAEITRLLAVNPPDGSAQQIQELEGILDYVKSHNANAAVVRLGKGSWSAGTVFDQAFTRNVPAMCAARGVPFLDLSHLLRDDEFMDAHHPTFIGAEKERDELAKFALTQLRAMGVQVDER